MFNTLFELNSFYTIIYYKMCLAWSDIENLDIEGCLGPNFNTVDNILLLNILHFYFLSYL